MRTDNKIAAPINEALPSPLPPEGFQIVNFLTQDEISWAYNEVRKLGYAKPNTEAFRISINQEPVERKQAIQEIFTPHFQSAFNRHIDGFRLMRVALFDKLPGGGSVRLHQHPHIIDESQYRSLAVWLPLVDTSIEMGTLHVVPYSHDIFIHKTRTHNDFLAFAGVSGTSAREFSKPIILKAGQAIIFDDRLLHWSPSNKSNFIRTAFQLELIPVQAPMELTVYYRDNPKQVSRYTMTPEIYRQGALTLKKSDALENRVQFPEPYKNYGDREIRMMMRGHQAKHPHLRRSKFANLFNRWIEPLD